MLKTGGIVLSALGVAGCTSFESTNNTGGESAAGAEVSPATQSPPDLLERDIPPTSEFVQGSRADLERGKGTVAIDTETGQFRFFSDGTTDTVTVIGGFLAANPLAVSGSWDGTADPNSKLIGTNVVGDAVRELSFGPQSFQGIALRAAESIDLLIDGVLVAGDVSLIRYSTDLGVFAFQQRRFDWRHSLGARGTSGSSTDDPDVAVWAEDIKVEPSTTDTSEIAVFNPEIEIDLNLRVREPATGKSILVETTAGAWEYAIRRIDIDVYEASGAIADDPTLFIDQQDEPAYSDKRWQTTVTGDRDIFTGSTFSEYVVDILNGSDELGTTDERTVGIGYETRFSQSGDTVRITRDDEVQPDWYVEFRLITRDPPETLARKEVANEEGTSMFEISVADLDVSPGSYDWELLMYKNRDHRPGERLIALGGLGERDQVDIS